MRDGIQNYPKIYTINERINIINELTKTGNYKYIEVGSIVSPRIEQMRQSDDVYKLIKKQEGILYGLLAIGNDNINYTINNCKPEVMALVTSPSNEFCEKNMHTTTIQSIIDINEAIKRAKENDIKIRLYISCCSTCPFTKLPMYNKIGEFVKKMNINYIDHIMISDTNAEMTTHMLRKIFKDIKEYVPTWKIGLHLHENKHSIKNINYAISKNIRIIDTVASNIGGCNSIKNPHNNLNINKILKIKYDNIIKMLNVSNMPPHV